MARRLENAWEDLLDMDPAGWLRREIEAGRLAATPSDELLAVVAAAVRDRGDAMSWPAAPPDVLARRRDTLTALRAEGVSYAAIGRRLGISKEAAHQIDVRRREREARAVTQ